MGSNTLWHGRFEEGPAPELLAFWYSASTMRSILSRISALSGWAMSLYEPSLRRFAGIAMNSPVLPLMTFRSRITKQLSSVIVT